MHAAALLFVLAGLSTLAAPAARADVCSDLKDAGISVSVQPAILPVQAGEAVELPLEIHVGHAEALESLSDVELKFSATSAHPGAAEIMKTVALKTQGIRASLPTTLRLEATSAMSGKYRLDAFLAGASATVCGFGLTLANVELRVANTASQTDIDPPKILSVTVNPSYRLGKSITFRLRIVDKSAVCTSSDTPAKCDPIGTAYVVGPDSDFIVTQFRLTPTERANEFLAVIDGDQFSEALDYRIQDLKVEDRWGNQSTQLPAALRKVLRLRTGSDR